ncbi:hypothetical protein IFM89_000101 [Coptis chinensis]|uniref:Uncharacterized protein n=1 Tax=Coptis chinensis TaxID=261450 RepID=A0A835HZ67_9MAGN|nr:hypothetical protein IFM89_000101 [Coptis chinensis]
MEHELLQQEHKKPTTTFELQKKQLGTELEMARDSLRLKEMEVLAAQRALTVRDEEMKKVVSKLDEKEMQLVKMKQETLDDPNGLNKIYALAQGKVGSKSVGLEALEVESVQLEADAATCALRSIGNMVAKLWKQAGLGTDSKAENIIFRSWFRGDESFVEAQRQVAQLSALTEQLVKEAGIFGAIAVRTVT